MVRSWWLWSPSILASRVFMPVSRYAAIRSASFRSRYWRCRVNVARAVELHQDEQPRMSRLGR